MATNTPNLNLVKPEMADYADIRVLNGNMDILDRAVGGLDYVKNVVKSDEGLTFTKKDDTQINVPLNYLPITGGNLTGDITIKDNDIDYIIEHKQQGRSYYNKYKSGKLVQVIYKDRSTVGVTGINVDTLTFLTPFIDETYLAWVSYEINVLTRYGWQNSALNPTVAGSGSNGSTEPRWGGRTTTNMAVTVDTETDVYACLVGRWR